MRCWVAAEAAEHLVYRLVADLLPEQGPIARCRWLEAARYSTPVEDCAIGRFSMSRWMASMCRGLRPSRRPGEGVVDLRFDRACAIEGLAEADYASIGVDAHPDDVGELLGAQGFSRST